MMKNLVLTLLALISVVAAFVYVYLPPLQTLLPILTPCAPNPNNDSRLRPATLHSRPQTSLYEYIPSGMSKSQWEKTKNKEKAKVRMIGLRFLRM